MMKYLVAIISVVLLLFSGVKLNDALTGSADEGSGLQVVQAYAYATAARQKNGAVFGTFHNLGSSDIRIISAQADGVAERIELHTHSHDGGIMMMREVEGYDAPSGEILTLEPSGHHIMLMGLKAPLTLGESFALELKSAAGETLSVNVDIITPGSIAEE